MVFNDGKLLRLGNAEMRSRLAAIPAIRSLNDACDFVLTWAGQSTDFPGSTIQTALPVPEAVRVLNLRLGAIWNDEIVTPLNPSSRRLNGGGRNLFFTQNFLYRPADFEKDEFGAVTVISENQGIYQLAYDCADPTQTLFVGDDDHEPDEGASWWEPIETGLETIFIAELLSNFSYFCRSQPSPEIFPSFSRSDFADDVARRTRIWEPANSYDLAILHRMVPYLAGTSFTVEDFLPIRSR